MKTPALVLLLTAVAVPAVGQTTIWDESVNGNFSSNELAPTPLVFAINTHQRIKGFANGDRDYITFTVPEGTTLSVIYLANFGPNFRAFTALNAGSTSQVPCTASSCPAGATNDLFLSGIYITTADDGANLLYPFDTRSITPNSLPSPSLGPGTYCWMIEQYIISQVYWIDFAVTAPLATEASTWGKVKALYR